MKKGWKQIQDLLPTQISMAHRMGAGAIALSLLTAPISLKLSILPLFLFVVLSFTAPFLPWFSFFLPIVSHGLKDKKAVAVTFDDGPNPASTPPLLDLLSKHQARATFYVTGRRAQQYPHLIHKITAMGHTIGNHSYSHDNFIMLKRTETLASDIEKAQSLLHDLGVFPLTYRPPVGITSPKLRRVIDKLGMFTVNFNRRAGDRGNREISHLSKKILKKMKSGDIIMLHDIPLSNKAMNQHWLDEVDCILAGIAEKNLTILPLAELIDRPIMADAQPGSDSNARSVIDAPPSE